MIRLPVILLGLATALCPGVTAQDERQPMDTAQRIAELEARLESDDSDAESHYELGQLLLASGRGGAEGHFRRATELAPDSAQYWLARANAERSRTLVLTRRGVGGLLDRAVEAAERTGSPALTEARYQRVRERWRRYEIVTHRYLMQGEATQVDLRGFMEDWRNVEIFFERFARPDPDPEGERLLDEIAAALDTALASAPGHAGAAGLRVVTALEAGAPENALEVADRAVRAAPDSPRSWALRGLALTQLERWANAEVAFDSALARMDASERRRYLDVASILKPVDATRTAELDPEALRTFASIYWGLVQPSYLSDLNEVRTEFFARLTYVEARGWRDERAAIYLRYGPPDIEASLGQARISEVDAVGVLESQRNTLVWAYTTFELRFVFTVAPGADEATFAGDFGMFVHEAARVVPVRFDNVAAVHDADTALVQLAQFRGDEDRTTLAVFGFTPIGRMAGGTTAAEVQLEAGVVVRDLRLRDAYRNVTTERIALDDTAHVERRSWRLSLMPGEYLLRVEAAIPALGQRARSTTPLRIDPFPNDSLRLSTVIVAERVEPRDSTPERWTDFFLDPSIGLFHPSEPVALLWEMYNLQPDSLGIARYRVDLEISVKDVERGSVAGRIIGGILDAVGLSARGDDAVALSYEGQAVIDPRAEKPEYLTVDLGNATPATYGVVLTITDLVSGQSVAQRRQFLVTEAEP
jgi:GWxTD domain-containing protein